MSSVSVPVIDDDVVEGNETFNVVLSISLSVHRITAGDRYITTVTITDSTSKYCSMHHSLVDINFYIYFSCCKNY